MTAQEEKMIQDLAARINSTQLSEKDPDAEQLLQQQLGRNADAMYILSQTALVQQYALEQAQKQLADARAQLEQLQTQPKHATSFLGSLLGRNDDQPRTPPPPMPQSNQQGWVPVQQYGPQGGGYTPPPPMYGQPQPGYGQAGYGPPPGYGNQPGGFLRSAMQTATGVAAGALAFEGIESLMHGFGGGGFGSGGGRTEEIVNNYYGDSGPREHERPLSSDIEDRRGDSSSFSDAVDRDDHGGDNLAAGSDSDDSDSGDSDDSSNFDDGSSMDDSGSSSSDDSF